MNPRTLIPVLLLAASAETTPPMRFEEVSRAAGIGFVHSFGGERLSNLVESAGGGAVWFDYDNDGLLDLYAVSGKPLGSIHLYPLRKPPKDPPGNHLYRNTGNGKFTDVTARAGVKTDLFGMGAVAADYDNDGYVDLLVTGYGGVVLYRNRGNGTFLDVTLKAGIKIPGWSIGASWLDYDRDGCTDLFVGRYVKFDPSYRSYYAADNYPGPLDYQPETNVLLRNNCNGSFTDVSEASGIAPFKSRAMGVTAADFDRDGWTDIYVANDKTENFLFHNQGDGKFSEIAVEAGVAYGQNGESTSAMGPVFLDFDHDGRPDLWVSDGRYNRLMRGSGKGFDDVTQRAGISQLTAQYVSWGTGAHDFDNDGLDDLFIVHGGLIHLVPQEHSLFRQSSPMKFEDVSLTAGPFFDVKSVGRGAAFGDYDNDGRVDAFIVNLGAPSFLLKNTSPACNHWLTVKLTGRKSNRDGIGAQVIVDAGGKRQQQERVAGSGYLSQDDHRLHFGLGSQTSVSSLTVVWPGGGKQVIENPPVDRVITVEEK